MTTTTTTTKMKATETFDKILSGIRHSPNVSISIDWDESDGSYKKEGCEIHFKDGTVSFDMSVTASRKLVFGGSMDFQREFSGKVDTPVIDGIEACLEGDKVELTTLQEIKITNGILNKIII